MPAWLAPSAWRRRKCLRLSVTNDSSMGNRIPQHRCVGIALIRLTVLEDCQDVVSQPAQFFDDREGERFRPHTAEPLSTPLRSRRFVDRFPPCGNRNKDQALLRSSARREGYARRISDSMLPSLRACTSTHTGILVRSRHGSPPHTPGVRSIPGDAWPRRRTSHCSACALSPGDSSVISSRTVSSLDMGTISQRRG